MNKKEVAEFEAEVNKRERRKFWLRLIIIVLIIHIILVLIKVPVTVYELHNISVQREHTVNLEQGTFQNCSLVEYNWEYQWDGYNAADPDLISPRLYLRNLENRRGTFHVQFAYFDQSQHDFGEYAGILYSEVAHILPWNDAAMHSQNFTIQIDGGDQKLLVAFTPKPIINTTYWTYALVNTPKLRKCTFTDINGSLDNTYNVTNTHRVPTKKPVSLWELLISWLIELAR